MKALQKNKQAIQRNGVHKSVKPGKVNQSKKSDDIDIVNNMIFSEYDVWPILAELHNRRN